MNQSPPQPPGSVASPDGVPLPQWVEPMKAVLVDQPFDSEQWLFETKFDGVRILAFLHRPERGGGNKPQVELRSRRGRDETARYPEVVSALADLDTGDTLLDGELVTPDATGRSSFHALQKRINLVEPAAIKAAVSEIPAVYFLFDLIFLNGRDLQAEPLEKRKALLRQLLAAQSSDDPGRSAALRYSEHVVGHGVQAFGAACQTGLEGVMAKRVDSPYRQYRSADWLKIKCVQEQDFVVCGWIPQRGTVGTIGALVLGALVLAPGSGGGWVGVDADEDVGLSVGANEGGGGGGGWGSQTGWGRSEPGSIPQGMRLIHVGRVGSGLDRQSRDELASILGELAVSQPPFFIEPDASVTKGATIHWTSPQVVVRVRFSSWTPDGKLREPRYMGIRYDLTMADSQIENPVSVPDPESGLASAPAPIPGPAPPPVPIPTPATSPARALAPLPHHLPPPFDIASYLTNLDKVFFPEAGITKGDLIQYYSAVSELILPHLHGRPLVMKRFPHGIGSSAFYQKEAPKGLPDWIPTMEVPHSGGRSVRYIIGGEEATMIYLLQLGTITMAPWFSRLPHLEAPDQLVFDIDPDGSPPSMVMAVVHAVRELLESMGLPTYPKTSGKEGIHIHVPLDGTDTFDDVRVVAEAVARAAQARHPGEISLERIPARRKGKVYVDFLQIAYGKTLASAYSVRSTAEASVATPLHWDEVNERLRPSDFNVQTVLPRFHEKGDLLAPVLAGGYSLAAVREKLAAGVVIG